MNNQNTTFSRQLAHQIRIRDLQGRWRRVSSLSLTDFEQLWNETAGEIREWKGFAVSTDEEQAAPPSCCRDLSLSD